MKIKIRPFNDELGFIPVIRVARRMEARPRLSLKAYPALRPLRKKCLTESLFNFRKIDQPGSPD